jgi:hypothetical protein
LIYECKCSPHAQAKLVNTLAFLITWGRMEGWFDSSSSK